MNRLLRNTGLYTLGNVLPQAVGFLLLPLYTHYLPPDEFGIVGSMQTLTVILALALTLAVDRAVYRLYWDHKSQQARKAYLGTILISLLSISTVMLGLLFVGRDLVALSFRSIPFFPYFAYAIVSSYFMTFGLVPQTRLQLEQRAGPFILLTLGQFLVSTACVLFFVVVKLEGAAGMLKGQLVGNAIMAPVYLASLRNAVSLKWEKRHLVESLRFSIPMIPALLSSWVLNLCDRIFIERYNTLSEVGIYSLSFRIATVVLIVTGALSKAYHPVFYEKANAADKTSAVKELTVFNNVFVLAVLGLCFLVSFFSKELVLLFLAPSFAEAYKIVPLIAVSYFFAAWLGLLNLSAYQDKKTVAVMTIQIVGAALNLVLNFILVPRLGPYGAAYARLIALAVIFAVLLRWTRKFFHIPYHWGRISLVALGLAAVFAVFHLLDLTVIESLVIKAVLVGVTSGWLFLRYRRYIMQAIPTRA